MKNYIEETFRPNSFDIEALNAVLSELIPVKDNQSMPGIIELSASEALLGDSKNLWLLDTLFEINQWSKIKYGVLFGDLNKNDRGELIAEDIGFWNEIIARVGPLALVFYFQHPVVSKALGLEFRPPFPVGYTVPQGNWDLLEPVYLRGQIYRDVE